MSDATQRFSSRVDNYVKYRPDYPAGILGVLRRECQLNPAATIADIGSGTGKLAGLFLAGGNRVLGVEPNAEMRQAGERLLASFPNFRSIAARAEATGLDDRSVDFVTAGQAFHWFDRAEAKKEFARILKPAGWVVLVWNERRASSTPFLCAYERLLLSFSTDYEHADHRQVGPDILKSFFGPNGYQEARFDNRQTFDLAALKGRLLSSSYTPEAGSPNFAPMMRELEAIFLSYQTQGYVVFEYDTKMFFGRLESA